MRLLSIGEQISIDESKKTIYDPMHTWEDHEACWKMQYRGSLGISSKGWLAIAKLIPLSLFISLLLMSNEAFDNVNIEK